MKKFLLLFLVLFLSACSIKITTDNLINEVDDVYGDEIAFNLNHVQLINMGQYSDEMTLQFDLYLEREDLGIKEPINDHNLYTSDLPEGIQPKIMTVKKDGAMCERSTFPHRCEAQITEKDLERDSLEYEIYIEFEDGYKAKKKVTIPLPKMIDEPLVTFPVNAPVQGSSMKMKFNDVGADSYIAETLLCHFYQDDGINPCLDGSEYSVIREDGKLIDNYMDDFYLPSVSTNNNVVEITSSMEVNYEESVQYIVTAGLDGVFEDGTTYYVESISSKSFETESEDSK